VRPRRRREPPRPPTPAIVNPRGQPPYRPGIDPDLPRAGRRLGPYGPRTGHAARPPLQSILSRRGWRTARPADSSLRTYGYRGADRNPGPPARSITAPP